MTCSRQSLPPWKGPSMTKPTGRPRGRPKPTASVTLMARVDVALADRVKRYAAAHRQPIAVVIRDALILLMEEYPAGTDPHLHQATLVCLRECLHPPENDPGSSPRHQAVDDSFCVCFFAYTTL